MRLEIVGVGQMYDMDSHETKNHLQVRGPGGLITIFTDEGTVQQLLNIAAGAVVAERAQAREPEEYVRGRPAQVEDVPLGAEVFGGDQEAEPVEEQPAENEAVSEDPVVLRNRARKNRGKPKIKDLVQSYHDDDSGVAVHDLPADEKGNPVIPGGLPDSSTVDEEEDPGEVDQI